MLYLYLIGIPLAFVYGALMSQIAYEAFCHHGPPENHPVLYHEYLWSGLNSVFSNTAERHREPNRWNGGYVIHYILSITMCLDSYWQKGLTYGRNYFNHPVSIPAYIG